MRNPNLHLPHGPLLSVDRIRTSLRRTVAGVGPLLALAPAFLSSGCDDGGGDIQEPGPVAQVVVTAPASTIEIGKSMALTVVALDAAGDTLGGHTFSWTTADPTVATVSESGVITAVAEGQTEISAMTEGISDSLGIVVLPSTSPPPSGSGTPGLQQVASGLAFPLYLTSPPDDDRLFVVEKGGLIRIIQNGTLLEAPFLDVSGKVSGADEQGLLGLAFPPDYASSGRFIVHYTDLENSTRLSMFRVSGDPNRADPASEALVLGVKHPARSHNGGQITFGPDGFLYLGLGDGGSRDGNDSGRGQSLGDLLGSIARIDVSGESGYRVPPDNPFVGTAGARPEIWSYGFRNPWRFSFDRSTGDLYIGDVGESRWEEVDRATAAEGGGRGLNYGWSRMEGDACMAASCDQSGITLPLVQYNHDEGCAVTSGYVYRGAAVPALQGQYVFGDFCQGWVRTFQATGNPGPPVDWPALRPGGTITSFGEDASGELYILTREGGVYKIVSK
jgi:glucose/arabinose dehydrogenase